MNYSNGGKVMKLKKIVVNLIIVLAIGIIAGFSYSIIDRYVTLLDLPPRSPQAS